MPTTIKIKGVSKFGCEFCRREVDNRSLGLDLAEEREKLGLSQADMARMLKISAPFVSDLEHGKRNWTPRMVERYVSALRGSKP
jgi:predicted transcriptional regulator